MIARREAKRTRGAGTERQAFIDRIELQPIDPQTNGPQLLYGLRYHQHVVKPGEIETYHDQIGYWLWEPATGMIFQTLAIPRAQVALAIDSRAGRGPATRTAQPGLDAYSKTVVAVAKSIAPMEMTHEQYQNRA